MPVPQTQSPSTVYEIVVLGRLNSERAEWFGDLALSGKFTAEGDPVTVFSGRLADQAALFGVLNRIRDLGLKLVSVSPSEPPRDQDTHGNCNQEES